MIGIVERKERIMNKIAAIVLAAGKGSRMQSQIEKQFMQLQDKPILYYSLKEFENAGVENIILVTGANNIEYCQKQIIDKYQIKNVRQIVAGGKERYESVYNGLQAAVNSEIVLIHDGARPFLTQEVIKDSIDGVKQFGACVVGVPVKDTIKVADANQICLDTPDRTQLWQIQTPQSFWLEEISNAYETAIEKKDKTITDDAMVMERYGKRKIKIIQGNYKNIKITTPEDMIIAEAFVNKE